MAQSQAQTITVDRVSNSGNAIARQQQAGKSVLVPAGEVSVGETYDVRLIDEGSHFEARLVDSTGQIQPSQPSVNPDTSDLGKGRGSSSHSHEIRSSPAGGKLRGIPGSDGKQARQRLSRRKK